MALNAYVHVMIRISHRLMRLVKAYCGGKYGYFSAHAANTSAIALIFTFVFKTTYKYLGIFNCLWASLVAYSRIYIGVHYPLDIITGMVR